MKIPIALFRRSALAALLALLPPTRLAAGEEEDAKADTAEAKKPAKDEEAKADAAKIEAPKLHNSAVKIGGREIRYTVATGKLPVLKEDGTPRAEVFYVYYAATGARDRRLADADPAARPLMFCFNGGPGSSAVWIHLGGLGPRRVNTLLDGRAAEPVAAIVDNPDSALDLTDLVFIDPVSTGLSRAAKGEKEEQFHGVDEDIESVGEFIRLFTTRERRWPSPKYLCGESYGVIRAAGLADYLQERHGMYFGGLVMVSGLLNWQVIGAQPGNDLPFILFLPSYTATAHYHKRLEPDLQADCAKAVAASRAFAEKDYALALFKGRAVGADERRRVAAEVARFTGLSSDLVVEQNLRIEPGFFRRMLLRKEGRILGAYDARVTAEDSDLSQGHPEFDPSATFVRGAVSAAINAYVRSELGYESDHPYRVLAPLPWRYTSFSNRYLSMEDRLGAAMKRNPALRMLVLTGRRDVVVPMDAMRYSVNHLPLPESLRGNVLFAEYESGHMMYFCAEDAARLHKDLAAFIAAPSPRKP